MNPLTPFDISHTKGRECQRLHNISSSRAFPSHAESLSLHFQGSRQVPCDNSGEAQDVKWDTSNSPEYTSFDHWNIRAAHWAGEYDITTGTYLSINHTNIAFSLSVVEEVVLKYKGNPNVVGIEPAISISLFVFFLASKASSPDFLFAKSNL